jgi:hypothetical protein
MLVIQSYPVLSLIRGFPYAQRVRNGHTEEEGATVPAAAQHAVTPVQATAGFLAQTIGQELVAPSTLPATVLIAAYRPAPSSAFEGLNFSERA